MRLIDALDTLNAARDRAERLEFDLLCGFQPLRLLFWARAQPSSPSVRRSGTARFGEFLSDFVEVPTIPTTLRITRQEFEAGCLPTYHAVERAPAPDYSYG
jgi:hypothetical protein